MGTDSKKNISFTNYFWTTLILLFFGVLCAARPQWGVVIAVIGLLALFSHRYLNSKISEGEDAAKVYPKRLAALCVLMYLFLPHLFYKLGDIGLFIQFGISSTVLIFSVFHVIKANNFKWKVIKSNFWMFAVILSVLISMVYGYAAKGVPVNPRDILAIKDPLFLFFMFTIFFQQEWNAQDIKRYFFRPLLTGGTITIILGLIQYLQIPGLNESVFAYWTEEQHLAELMKPDARRIFSTFYSAGNFGIFLVLLMTHFLAAFFSNPGLKRVSTAIGFILAVVALFMVASKGTFILFLLMIFLFPIIYFRSPTVKFASLGAIVVIVTVFTILSWSLLSQTYMMKRMESVFRSAKAVATFGTSTRPEEVLDETSIGRVAPWVRSAPMIKASPILGYGPGKTLMKELGYQYRETQSFKNPFESSYLQIVFRFGLIGVIVNFGLMLNFILMHLKVIRLKECPTEFYRIASVGVIFGLLLYVIFLNTDCIFNIRLMAPVYAAAGISASFLFQSQHARPLFFVPFFKSQH
ncbi:O-antigen ligase family protein [bacterium]|nr:O-antigen ligase family protein [bacterium]MBU1024908.1 O-antigen ligase family protein [bacterium]